MSKADEIAEQLAAEALDFEKRTGNASVVNEMGKIIGASSATLEDAFLNTVRVLRAEALARAYFDDIKTKGTSSRTAAVNADD